MSDVEDVHTPGAVRDYFFSYSHRVLDSLAITHQHAVPENQSMVDRQAESFLNNLLEGVTGAADFRTGFQEYYDNKKKQGDNDGETKT